MTEIHILTEKRVSVRYCVRCGSDQFLWYSDLCPTCLQEEVKKLTEQKAEYITQQNTAPNRLDLSSVVNEIYPFTSTSIHGTPEPHLEEVEIPTRHETFEAQVLVTTLPRKEALYMSRAAFRPLQIYTFEEINRLITSGNYRIELIQSTIAGKPLLLVLETEEKRKEREL